MKFTFPYQLFMLNFCFETGSMGIIFKIFDDEYYNFMYTITTMSLISLVAYLAYPGRSNSEKFFSSLYFTSINIIVRTRCPIGRYFSKMVTVTTAWTLKHWTTLVIFTIKLGAPGYQIGVYTPRGLEWTNIAHKTFFLIMGPLAVWLTKKAKGWGPNKRDLTRCQICTSSGTPSG